MTIIDPARDDISALRDLCGGAVALPGDDGYDAARQGLNLAVDQRPAAIAYPADADEVADVIRCARVAGLRVAPQATWPPAPRARRLRMPSASRSKSSSAVTLMP